MTILTVAEAALFALLGLLIAFTFSGAYERYEGRKILIIDEANTIHSAYLLLDLLDPIPAGKLREDFRQYIQNRMDTYKNLNILNYHTTRNKIRRTRQMQINIWRESIEALKIKPNSSTTELLLPALNDMFATANKQATMSRVHPPVVLFALLFGLALLSAFLTGYSISRKKFTNKKSIYIFSYIAVMTITIYVILDLELPRLGLIRVTPFDATILQVNRDILTNKFL